MEDSKSYIPAIHSDQSRRTTENGQSQYSTGYTEGFNSSTYTVEVPTSSFQTPRTTDIASDITRSDIASYKESGRTLMHSPQSYTAEHGPKENIRFMPVKVKDLMDMFKSNPAYRDKSPVMINMKENDIDQIMEDKRNGNGINLYSSPQHSLKGSLRGSPISVRQSAEEDLRSRRSLASSPRSFNEELKTQSSNHESRSPRPPLGENQAHQVYAMTDIQAYPMIGNSSFRANKSRKRSPRVRSRRRSPSRHAVRKPRRRRTRSRRRSPPRSRLRSRGRSFRRRSRPKRIVRKSPVVIVKRRHHDTCCTPFPLCENACVGITRPIYPSRATMPMYPSRAAMPVYPSRTAMPMYPSRSTMPMYPQDGPIYTARRPEPIFSSTRLGYSTSRPVIRPSRVPINCTCNLCTEKLQFIQPGVCSKRKYMWTNEYAIIPKPQVNLIDPCEELDSSIYPRADNPCIRDGRGNPLTDCIGRPLRDPIGKKFLSFTANGSVMDTNFRGNFYTGQPPLCVKCPMPGNTCAPDTTHNWWMSCGYPIRPNMTPFIKHVLAAEHLNSKI